MNIVVIRYKLNKNFQVILKGQLRKNTEVRMFFSLALASITVLGIEHIFKTWN